MVQLSLPFLRVRPKGQLLKWVGNKYRFANDIVSVFPYNYNKYIEPFVGTGAVLATLRPHKAIASDILKPLIDFWNILKEEPEKLVKYYTEALEKFKENRLKTYEEIKERFNKNPNPYDMLVICRTCYGGVMRFRKSDGYLSTPIGPHNPIPAKAFAKRVYEWRERVLNTEFYACDYKKTLALASEGDIVYCDPPYYDTQRILYGSQGFDFKELYDEIKRAKERGALVALSIDHSKKSLKKIIDVGIPQGLFERELIINCGKSMLRRFQKNGLTMDGEEVRDRLLLTW